MTVVGIFRGGCAALIVLAAIFGPGSPVAASSPTEPQESSAPDTDARDAWLEGEEEDESSDPEAVAEETPGADLRPASVLVREGKLDEAEALLEALRQDHPDDADVLILLGEVRVAARRFETAVPLLREAIAIAPDRPRPYFQLGTALASTGDLDGALEAFAGVLTRSEDAATLVLTRLNRSLLLQRQSRWREAAAELESVLQFEPERTRVYGDLASLYVQAGDADAAVRALKRGESAGFRSAIHWYSAGALLFQAERLEDARASFESALALDPDRAEAERSLGAVLDRLGRSDEAAVHLRRYLELRPDADDRAQVESLLEAYETGTR